MRVEIDTHDRNLAFDLMDTSSLSRGQEKTIPGGATIMFEGQVIRKAFGFPETIELAISFGTGVTSGLVANWLFSKLKSRATTLRIERREVEIENGEIKRVIEEIIHKST